MFTPTSESFDLETWQTRKIDLGQSGSFCYLSAFIGLQFFFQYYQGGTFHNSVSVIYHVTTAAQWESCKLEDRYFPAAFVSEGFIHACHRHQLKGVLERYFGGQTNLLLLHIDEQKLTCQLKEEPGTGNELFPHIFGGVDKSAVVKVEPIGL